MFGILTADLTKCQGRYGVAMGERVLARECQNCVRRTWPTNGNMPWIEPPKQRPCPEHLPPSIWGEVE